MNHALYDDNAMCMLNIIFYSECLYDCLYVQVCVIIYSVSAI